MAQQLLSPLPVPYFLWMARASQAWGFVSSFSSSVSRSCQVPTAPQVEPWHSGRGKKGAGPPLRFRSPQEEKGAADGHVSAGKAEQMARGL